jgi:Mg/Co/Ni transporter MgtE
MEYELDKMIDDAIPRIIELIEEKKYIKARELLLEFSEVDIAEILEEIMEVLRNVSNLAQRCQRRSFFLP